MKPVLVVLLLGVALAADSAQPAAAPVGTAQSEVAARPAQWATPVDVSRNLYRIEPGFYRAAQPNQGDAELMKQLGIRTIISFRAKHPDEGRLNFPDVKLVRIPMDTWSIRDDQIVAALRAIESARKDGPVLIHCQHGADRTGVVSAMYRIIEQGWTPEQALSELRDGGYGFHSIWFNIPRYVRRVNIEALRAGLASEAGKSQ
ncbi:MAG: dual specificity protein phosphatase family protein [Nevskiaceae bacterium]|jgi:protein tyrosine/serine phosphatase|nr:dual specificity protein phosphatase family protein [Nevskiaceae bacterium]